jgi:hypothetical protein
MAPLAPLSHHEILALVAPFSRAGCALDLAASDRAERRLLFKPVAHPATGLLPALTEQLTLHDSGSGWRLTRHLQSADGLRAQLSAEGDDPGALLSAIQAVPPQRQFPRADGLSAAAALSHRCGPQGQLVLREAEARVCGLRLHMKVSGVRGYPAALDLRRAEDDPRRLPSDLLEVQGRAWTRLEARRQGWEASVQLRGPEPQRSTDAEGRLAETLQHLQRTLSEPPERFHQRHLTARWRVGLSRAGPLMLGVLLVAAAFAVRGRGGAGESALAALANLAPPLLMALFFMRREMPRIELPHWPRAPALSAWQPWADTDPPHAPSACPAPR